VVIEVKQVRRNMNTASGLVLVAAMPAIRPGKLYIGLSRSERDSPVVGERDVETQMPEQSRSGPKTNRRRSSAARRAQHQLETCGAARAELNGDTVAASVSSATDSLTGSSPPRQRGDDDRARSSWIFNVLVKSMISSTGHARRLTLTVNELAQLGRPNTVLPYLVQNPHLLGYLNPSPRMSIGVPLSRSEATLHHRIRWPWPTEVQHRGETSDTSAKRVCT